MSARASLSGTKGVEDLSRRSESALCFAAHLRKAEKMGTDGAGRRFLRGYLLKFLVIALVACAVLIVYARVSKKSTGPFALASDVPRGALLYAQFSDLPALVKHWDESQLKEQYLTSTNFQQFQSRHLALKLI